MLIFENKMCWDPLKPQLLLSKGDNSHNGHFGLMEWEGDSTEN